MGTTRHALTETNAEEIHCMRSRDAFPIPLKSIIYGSSDKEVLLIFWQITVVIYVQYSLYWI